MFYLLFWGDLKPATNSRNIHPSSGWLLAGSQACERVNYRLWSSDGSSLYQMDRRTDMTGLPFFQMIQNVTQHSAKLA